MPTVMFSTTIKILKAIGAWFRRQFSWTAAKLAYRNSFAKTLGRMEKVKARQKRGYERMGLGKVLYGENRESRRKPSKAIRKNKSNRGRGK